MCFALWDRTPHAWAKVAQWSAKREEFIKRAAFAMLWSLAVHDKQAGNEQFVEGLALIERAAADERNFVKKAVNMALRAVGRATRAHQAAIAGPSACGVTRSNTRGRKRRLRELTALGSPRLAKLGDAGACVREISRNGFTDMR